MKHISAQKVFFTILLHLLYGIICLEFIEGRKIKTSKRASCPLEGIILAPSGFSPS